MIIWKAVRIIVLPAPVSPVKTVKPLDISKETSSITPMFWIRRSLIIYACYSHASLQRAIEIS